MDLDIEVRLEGGKKGKIVVRQDGSFLIKTTAGLREPTKKEKALLAPHVRQAWETIQKSRADAPKDRRDYEEKDGKQ